MTVLQAALAAGAGPLYVSEPRAARRTLAPKCGADEVIDPAEMDPVSNIDSETNGGADVTFEVAGAEQSVAQALASARAGGTATIVSIFEDLIRIDLNNVVMPEQTVVGTAAFEGGPLSRREFGTTIRTFATGAFDPEPLVTSRIILKTSWRTGSNVSWMMTAMKSRFWSGRERRDPRKTTLLCRGIPLHNGN
ncbi:zinc-binding dehydrogenase [Halegenticoccus tardaugens]|uniref:zinc-binding dehydrogenase n=1 Tax=Halegenticoccus tardaugens TaxID=2071624 RepID=UPI0013E91738|nr:zinc-binding dehydrogenase [Halegenticoccus tardaugens]